MEIRVTQESKILEYLKTGRGITSLEALDLFGCFRLQARIADLRRKGYMIRTDMIPTNTGKRVARYVLENFEEYQNEEEIQRIIPEIYHLKAGESEIPLKTKDLKGAMIVRDYEMSCSRYVLLVLMKPNTRIYVGGLDRDEADKVAEDICGLVVENKEEDK